MAAEHKIRSGDPEMEGRENSPGNVSPEVAQASTACPPVRRRRRLTWLVLLGAVLVLSWLLYRAPLARELGVRCLGHIGSRGVPLLRQALWDKNGDVLVAAREELSRLGETAVPALVRSLQSDDTDVRLQSLQALAILRQAAKDATPVIVLSLHDSDETIRLQSLTTLAMIGPQGREVRVAVGEAMSDRAPSVRKLAVQTLCAVTANEDDAIPLLIKALRDPDRDVRLEAIEALEPFGPRAAEAVSALREIANDPDPTLRKEAAETLEAILPAEPGTSGKPAP